jgi:hypothetical protein
MLTSRKSGAIKTKLSFPIFGRPRLIVASG